ncbi:nucleoside deaminase [Undibacter mobilis]
MQRAIDTARMGLGQAGHRPFAAVIARNGSVVCEAVSLSGSGNDPTAHAEILAVRDACDKLGTRDLSDCDLYATCEPCPLCVAAIWYARIRKTYYAATVDDCGKVGIHLDELIREVRLPIAKRRQPSEQLMRPQAQALFSDWASAQISSG